MKEAVSSMCNPAVIDASITSDGKAISGLGDVTLSVPYRAAEGSNVRAWYIVVDGTKESVPCSYDNGTAALTVSHLAHYALETYTLQDNTLTVKTKTATIKYSRLKKSEQTISARKLMKISGAAGTVTYKKISGNKNFTVNKKTGAVTIKKGTKKGTYKLKIKVTDAGGGDYAAGEKTVTVKVKVK